MDCLSQVEIEEYAEERIQQPLLREKITTHMLECDSCWLNVSDHLLTSGLDANAFMWRMKALLRSGAVQPVTEPNVTTYRMAAAGGKRRPTLITSWISEEASMSLHLWRDETGQESLCLNSIRNAPPQAVWLVKYRHGDAILLHADGNHVNLPETSLMLASRGTLPIYPALESVGVDCQGSIQIDNQPVPYTWHDNLELNLPPEWDFGLQLMNGKILVDDPKMGTSTIRTISKSIIVFPLGSAIALTQVED